MDDLAIVLVLFAIAKVGSLAASLPGMPKIPEELLPLPKYRKPQPWTPIEMRRFVQDVGPVGLDLEALLLVIYAESGCNPHATNGSYVGLMQTGKELRDAVKWPGSGADYAALDVIEQSPWLAKILRVQIARLGRTPINAKEIWCMNLAPARLRAGVSELYSNAKHPVEYAANKQLDVDKDGVITIDDLWAVLIKLSLNTYFLNQRDALRDAVRALKA